MSQPHDAHHQHHAAHHHRHCQRTALAHAEAYCARHNLRFTEVRRQVFAIIWRSHRALTAADIMAALGNSQPPITYRALEFLTAHGLIHHVTSLNAYVGCAHPDEHTEDHIGQLLICTSCRTVTELEPARPLTQLRAAADKTGFHVTRTHIEMLGQCQACRA